MNKRYFVTGGAGFVGSHLVALLLDCGHECLVFDNLQTGQRQAVLPGAEFVEGRLEDEAALDSALQRGPFDAVFHFAALSLVGESMREPMRYLTVNPGNSARLIDASVRHNVKRLVFSSTANVFGLASKPPFSEAAVVDPGSPYGESKLMVERMLRWADRLHGLRFAALRYFNAAGADPKGRLGEHHDPETHLIPLAIDTALGLRPPLQVFGNDYPTADGTCIRDYVHVSDLATAHLKVLDRLEESSVFYNLGTGHGFSVMEVIRSVERVSGREVPFIMADRRGGDPPVLVAAPDRVKAETGWSPEFTNLDAIVESALIWRQRNPYGYPAA